MSNEPAEHDRQPETASRLALRGGSLAGAIVLSGAMFVAVLSTRGRFDMVYADLGWRELPAITHLVRSALFAWIVGTLFGLTITKEFLLNSRSMRAACNTAAVIAAFVLGALYVFGMFRPLIILIEKVSL